MNRSPRRRLAVMTFWLHKKTERYLPPPIRAVVALLLLAGGILGFLPILGFWMIPLGLGVLATDIPPLRRWLRKRLQEHRRARD